VRQGREKDGVKVAAVDVNIIDHNEDDDCDSVAT